MVGQTPGALVNVLRCSIPGLFFSANSSTPALNFNSVDLFFFTLDLMSAATFCRVASVISIFFLVVYLRITLIRSILTHMFCSLSVWIFFSIFGKPLWVKFGVWDTTASIVLGNISLHAIMVSFSVGLCVIVEGFWPCEAFSALRSPSRCPHPLGCVDSCHQ